MDLVSLCDDIWVVIISYLDIYSSEILTSAYFPSLSPLFGRVVKRFDYDIDSWALQRLSTKYSKPGTSRLSKCGYIYTFVLPVNKLSGEATDEIWRDFVRCACDGGMTQLEQLQIQFDVWNDVTYRIYNELVYSIAANHFPNMRCVCFKGVVNFEVDPYVLSRNCPLLAEVIGLSFCMPHGGDENGSNALAAVWNSLVTLPVEAAVRSLLIEDLDDIDPATMAVALDHFTQQYYPMVYRLDFQSCDCETILKICLSLLYARSYSRHRADCVFAAASCLDFSKPLLFNVEADRFEVQQQWTDAIKACRMDRARAEAKGDRALPTSLATSMTDSRDAIFPNVFFVSFRELIPSPLLMTLMRAGPNNSRHFNPYDTSSLLFHEPRLSGSSSARVEEVIPRSLRALLEATSLAEIASEEWRDKYDGIVLQCACDDLTLFSYLQNTWSHDKLPIAALIMDHHATDSVNELRKCRKICLGMLQSRHLENLCLLHITAHHLRDLLLRQCDCGSPHSPLLCGSCDLLAQLQCLVVDMEGIDDFEREGMGVAVALMSGLHTASSGAATVWPLVEFVLGDVEMPLLEVAECLRSECKRYVESVDSLPIDDDDRRCHIAPTTTVYLSRKGHACFKLFQVKQQ
jgi:hypothetical protein